MNKEISTLDKALINTIDKATITSPHSQLINTKLQLLKIKAYITNNKWDSKMINNAMPFIFQGVLNNFILGEDYWILPYKGGRLSFAYTQAGNKKWLSLNGFNIINWTTNVVWKDDEFKVDLANNKIITHIPGEIPDDEKIYNNIKYAYCIMKYQRKGTKVIEEKLTLLDNKQLKQLRKASPSNNSNYSPYMTFPESMAKAKVSNELMKQLSGIVSVNITNTATKPNELVQNAYKLDNSIGVDELGKTEYASLKELENTNDTDLLLESQNESK